MLIVKKRTLVSYNIYGCVKNTLLYDWLANKKEQVFVYKYKLTELLH